MHRQALQHLIDWTKKVGAKPLVLRGARQVGKSTLVRLLSQQLGLDLLEVNLEKNKLREFENESDFSVEKVVTEIEVVARKKIGPDTLLFLDEIQAQPAALNGLRYFYEDKPEVKVISAGSLLEMVIHRQRFTMPVGRVEYYYLGPMTFFEFLEAADETVLQQELQRIDHSHLPNKTVHERAIEMLRLYSFIGGMPEAVKRYADSRDLSEVRDVHESIIQTYRDDISKYSEGSERDNILSVFDYTPAHLGKKVVFSHISEMHSSYVKDAISILAMANVVYKVCHNRCSGLPLKAGADCSTLKLYLLDIGLYNAMMELVWSDLYKLSPEELLTKGNMAEQFVAQHLAFRNPRKAFTDLSYWLRGGSKGAAEVDFVISEQSKIYPLEVKSGATGKMRSLWQLIAEKGFPTAVRLDLSLRKKMSSQIEHWVQTADGTKMVECELLGVPLYAIENLAGILQEYNRGKP